MKLVTDTQYEHVQVAVDLLHENVTFVHCYVAVCINLSLFLCLKESVVNFEFGPQCHVARQESQRLANHKIIA